MLIKQAALTTHLRKNCSPVYVLVGQDEFLMMQSVKAIKAAWKQLHPDSESVCYSIEQSQDWQEVYTEANSYTIFSQQILIDARFNKKSLDVGAKKMLSNYLEDVNTRTLLLIQAPLLTAKLLSSFATHEACTIVQIFSLNAREMQQWIKTELTRISLTYSEEVIELILQHTMGNHLACAQLIEKLALIYPQQHALSSDDVRIHLSFQCDDDLFELAEACLNGDLEKAIRCVRIAFSQKKEATLILWILAQEIRLLLQIHAMLEQRTQFSEAASRLKIWNQRAPAYRKALDRLAPAALHGLLRQCQRLDQGLKLGQVKNIALEIEMLLVALSRKRGTATWNKN